MRSLLAGAVCGACLASLGWLALAWEVWLPERAELRGALSGAEAARSSALAVLAEERALQALRSTADQQLQRQAAHLQERAVYWRTAYFERHPCKESP